MNDEIDDLAGGTTRLPLHEQDEQHRQMAEIIAGLIGHKGRGVARKMEDRRVLCWEDMGGFYSVWLEDRGVGNEPTGR